MNIYLIRTVKKGESVEIRVFCSDTYERVACANKRMRIETSKNIEKSEFYEMEAESFYFLVFFQSDDKIVIKRKTSDLYG